MCFVASHQYNSNRIGTRISNRSDVASLKGGVRKTNLISVSPIDLVKFRSENQSISAVRNRSRSNNNNLIHIRPVKNDESLLRFHLLNAQSVRNKFDAVNDYILNEKKPIFVQ